MDPVIALLLIPLALSWLEVIGKLRLKTATLNKLFTVRSVGLI
jgi:hypothetical protein